MKNKIDLQVLSPEDLKLINNQFKHVNIEEKDKISIDIKYDEVENNITYNIMYLEFINMSDNAHRINLTVDNRETNKEEDAGTFVISPHASERIDFIDIVPYLSSAYTGLTKAKVDILGKNTLKVSFDDESDVYLFEFDERALMIKYGKIK